jgi:hypothetical protein
MARPGSIPGLESVATRGLSLLFVAARRPRAPLARARR